MRQIFLPLLLATLFACSEPKNKNIDEDIVQYITNPHHKRILSCADTLYFGDTLKIKFKVPHSKDLTISAPGSDKYYFLSADSLLIPSYDRFANQEYFEIITNATKRLPYVQGSKERELIFNKSGVYQIKLSENLETEGILVELVEVVYINQKKL